MVAITALLTACILLILSDPALSEQNAKVLCNSPKLEFYLDCSGVKEGCGKNFKKESVKYRPTCLKFEDADPVFTQVISHVTNKMAATSLLRGHKTMTDGEMMYAILMVDPDYTNTSAKEEKYYLHWMLEDLPGSELQKGNFVVDNERAAEEASEEDSSEYQNETPNYEERIAYIPPDPPAESGVHRYQFFVYAQDVSAQDSNPFLKGVPEKAGGNFDLKTFEKENTFDKPLAVFQYQINAGANMGSETEL